MAERIRRRDTRGDDGEQRDSVQGAPATLRPLGPVDDIAPVRA
jgi:hypothetical protein